MLNISLGGKVALVLGGSRGIGAGITKTLCQAGATVAFTHTGNPQNQGTVSALLEEIEHQGGQAEAHAVTALDSADTRKLVDGIVERFGRIDILVCNVGQNVARAVEEVGDEDWTRFIELNLSSAFYGVRAVLPHMVRMQYGRIVLIGSSAVFDGGGGAIDYAAAKAGLSGMMAYLCRNYARKGILTNIIHPCVIETDLLKIRYGEEESRQKLIDQIPAGRLGQPEDIAGLVAYLSSSWGDYICGQEILADGGRTFFNR
jgi:3-oxoacyl-[acyl-carrier protein] reductase